MLSSSPLVTEVLSRQRSLASAVSRTAGCTTVLEKKNISKFLEIQHQFSVLVLIVLKKTN